MSDQRMPAAHATGDAPPQPPRDAARRRRTVLWGAVGVSVALVLVVLLVLVVRDTPGARLTRAVDTTLGQGSATTSITGVLRDVPVAGDVTLSVAEGELDMEAGRASLRRELPFLSGRDLPVIGEIGDVELLYADGGAWLRGPFDTERAWIRVRDAQDEAAAAAPGLGNPLALLALVRAIDGTPETVDEETVGGVATTRYRVTVDLDALDGELGEGSRQLLDNLRRLHEDGRLPMDVWVDEHDLIRRLRYEAEVDLSGLPRLRMATEVDLDRHGLPVSIQPPATGEVVELSADQLRQLNPLEVLRDWIRRVPFIGD